MPREEMLLETRHRFAGDYDQVPLAPGIDVTTLTEGDEKPFFVTLPIGKVGARSRNRRNYDREAIAEIVQQINEKRPGGNLGHLKDADRSHVFNLPAIYWVGATLNEQTGVAWGKFYVPTYRQDVREYYRLAMRRNAAVATSLYGTTETDAEGNVRNPLIEGIDVADPNRAGVMEAVAVPKITSEMTENTQPPEEDIPVENNYAELITERDLLKRQLAEAQSEIATLKSSGQANVQALHSLTEMAGQDNVGEAIKALKAFQESIVKETGSDKPLEAIQALKAERNTLAEVAGSADAVKAMRSTLAEVQKLVGDKPIEAITALQGDLTATRTELTELLEEHIGAVVENAVKVPAGRGMVRTMLASKNPKNREQVKTMLAEVLDAKEVKDALGNMVVSTMGGAQKGAVVTPPPAEGRKGKYFTIPRKES